MHCKPSDGPLTLVPFFYVIKRELEYALRVYYYPIFRLTFAVDMELRLMFTHLPPFIVYMHYMFRPNWPFSSVHVMFII
jgi:hypothetical protein